MLTHGKRSRQSNRLIWNWNYPPLRRSPSTPSSPASSHPPQGASTGIATPAGAMGVKTAATLRGPYTLASVQVLPLALSQPVKWLKPKPVAAAAWQMALLPCATVAGQSSVPPFVGVALVAMA